MVYPPELLDRLQAVDLALWAGQAFRHMFRDYPPDAENTRGARWNPPGVAAIYTSLARDGVVAEAEHQIAVQPIRPRARRTIYTLELTLVSVLDLTDPDLLQDLGVGAAELAADDMTACREVGKSAVPHTGSNTTGCSCRPHEAAIRTWRSSPPTARPTLASRSSTRKS